MTTIRQLAFDAQPRSDDDWGSEDQIAAENLFFEQCEILDPEHFGELGDFQDQNLKATSEERIEAALQDLKARQINMGADLCIPRIASRHLRTLRELAADAMPIDDEDRDSSRQTVAADLFREMCRKTDPDLFEEDPDAPSVDTVELDLSILLDHGLADTIIDLTPKVDAAAIHAILRTIKGANTLAEAISAVPADWAFTLIGPDPQGLNHSMIVPAGHTGAAKRLHDQGICIGQGISRLEAIKSAGSWLHDRIH